MALCKRIEAIKKRISETSSERVDAIKKKDLVGKARFD